MNSILISLIFCTIYSFVIYQILNRRINNKIDNKTFLKKVHQEINSLITQINETSDRNVLLLENRLEKLSSMLSQADLKMTKMKESIKINKEVDTAVSKPVSNEVKLKEEVKEYKEESTYVSNQDIKDDPALSRKDRILLLHKQGISSTVIATQTKATIGEVELIISLNRS